MKWLYDLIVPPRAFRNFVRIPWTERVAIELLAYMQYVAGRLYEAPPLFHWITRGQP